MKPLYTRLICRAHNRFSPSLFLRQHLGVLERPFPHHHRLLSTAANAPSNEPLDVRDDTPPPETGESAPPVMAGASEKASHPLRIKKMKTVAGDAMLPNKKFASIRKHKAKQNKLQEAGRNAPSQLLLHHTSGDYVGVVVEPMSANGSLTKIHYPWVVDDVVGIDGAQRLNLEIERFFQYTTPNEHELAARAHIAEKIRGLVQRILRSRKVEIFGSERTGLALSTSDIDLRLLPEELPPKDVPSGIPPRYAERKRNIRQLESLKANLARSHGYILPTLRYARYPLVGFQDHDSGLDVQVVASNDTSLSRDIMNDYMKQYPYLRQLYILVKVMFEVRGLTDVFRGGFGSYPLFMMIVASIKHHPHRNNDAAGALINFLHFYGTFNTTEYGISIDPVEIFEKAKDPIMSEPVKNKLEESKSKRLPEYLLALRDPADETNDVGRKGIAIRHVQTTFKKLGYDLQRDIKMNTRLSLLDPLVGTSYMLNKALRMKLQLYGKQVAQEKMKTLAQKARAIRESEKEEERRRAEEQAVVEGDQAGEEVVEEGARDEQKQKQEQAQT